MNESWSRYYENTKALKPSRFLVETFKSFDPKPGLAIDLGCGAGRDTRWNRQVDEAQSSTAWRKCQAKLKHASHS